MPHTSEEAPLFDDDGVRVTPTWLTLGDTSHAMQTLRQVRFAQHAVSRRSWTQLFFVSLALVVIAAFGMHQTGMPYWFGRVLLVASLLICLTASWFAFVQRDVFRLEVVLDDGNRLLVERPGKRYMMALEKALREAVAMQGRADSYPGNVVLVVDDQRRMVRENLVSIDSGSTHT